MTEERPIHAPLKRETSETWRQVNELFSKNGLPIPPASLRDEIVIAFEWAWWGLYLDAGLQEKE